MCHIKGFLISNGMKFTKYGHCCLLIESKGLRILTDPGSYSNIPENLQHIDIILITHEHEDHLHIESLKKLLKGNPDAKVITNTSVGRLLEKESISYEVVSDGQEKMVEGIKIEGCGTTHAEVYKEFGQVENTGYFIDEKFFYPGDAFYNPKKSVDMLALPVAGPWCKIREAIEYALALRPRVCFPVHDGILVNPGMAHFVPNLVLPKSDITFVALQPEEETEL